MTYKVVDDNFEEELLPNDPLYLAFPNNLPDGKTGIKYNDKAIMELKSNDDDINEGKIELAYTNPKTNLPEKSDVIFRFSFIKDEVWQAESDKTSKFQNHLNRNTGISFVRDGREIDFGNFGYFVSYDLTDRYWGCEIRFSPVLDSIFGVSNDKQGVRNIGPISKSVREDDGITDEDVASTPNLKLRVELTKRFEHFKNQYKSQLKKKGEGKRKANKRSETIADRIIKKRDVITRSKILSGGKTQEQIDQEIKDRFQRMAKEAGQPPLTEEQLNKLLDKTRNLQVKIEFGSWLGSEFFSTEISGSSAIANINQEHKFYTKLYHSLSKELDTTNVEIVDLMLIAFTRAEDELAATSVDIKDFVKIKEKWGQILTELLEEQDKSIN